MVKGLCSGGWGALKHEDEEQWRAFPPLCKGKHSAGMAKRKRKIALRAETCNFQEITPLFLEEVGGCNSMISLLPPQT